MDSDTKDVPDFFLPGAAKAGSSTLNSLLDRHGSISMAEKKDSMFFDRDDANSHIEYAINRTEDYAAFSIDDDDPWDAYLENYPDDDTLKGEANVSYMYSEQALQNITAYIEDPQAIFILRDPVERSYSHYWHQLRNARTVYSFKSSLMRDRRIFDGSLYTDRLRQWEQELGEDNIHVLLLEELIEEPQETMNEFFHFLGVESTDIELPKNNPGSFPRLPRLYQAFNLLLYILGKETTTASLRDDEYWSLPEKAFRKLMLTDSKPSMDPRLREKLETIFRKENSDIIEYAPQAEQYWSIFED